jgi:segregation and condensation protein B
MELDRLQATPRDTALSQNSIDCLSLIAYRPGITKSELETMWGQNAGATLSYLIKKSLIRIEQQSPTDIPRYFTTARFLEILGVESLDDLPQGEEP